MHFIILSAGQGTRFGGNVPKCLLEVGEESLLERHFDNMKKLGAKDCRVVIGHGGIWTPDQQSSMRAKVNRYKGMTIVNKDSLETHSAASLGAAFFDLKYDLLVVDGDIFYSSSVVLELARQEKTTIVINRADARSGGSRVLLKVAEKPHGLFVEEISETTISDYVYSGMMKICADDIAVYKKKLASGCFDSYIMAVFLNKMCHIKPMACLIADNGADKKKGGSPDYSRYVVKGNVININTKKDLLRTKKVA